MELNFLIQSMTIIEPSEMANFITEKAVELELSDEACEKAASIAADLDLYPFIGEEDDDKYTFEHAGLMCQVKRNHLLVWCGYVDFPHENGYDDINDNIEVHGGITFGDGNTLGFDCAHWGDVMPRSFIHKHKYMESNGIEDNNDETYKDYNYVVEETKRLAEQLAAL